jgi:hypothetical protein
LLGELEKIMVLLAYDDISKSPYKDLGTVDQLKKLAQIINLEILNAMMQSTGMILITLEIVLPTLFKLLKWSQNQLKSELTFPEITSIYPLKYIKPESK